MTAEVSFANRSRAHAPLLWVDSAALLLPLLLYYLSCPISALWFINTTVPIVLIVQSYTGIQALRQRGGNWSDFEIKHGFHWWLIVSTWAGVLALSTLPQWYLSRGWDMVGLHNHLKWSYLFYVKCRVIVLWHTCLLDRKAQTWTRSKKP